MEKMDGKTEIPVDIEEIMRELRAQIAEKGPEGQIPSFDEISIESESAPPAVTQEDWGQFMESLHFVNCNYDIPYYRDIGPRGVKWYVKRVIRKLVKFLIVPILTTQNLLNANVVRCLNNIRFYIEGDRERDQQLRDELEAMRYRVSAQDGQIRKLQQNLARMEETQQEQRQTLEEQTQQIAEQRQTLEEQAQQIVEQRQTLEEQAQQIVEQRQMLETQAQQVAEHQKLLETHGSHFGVQEAKFQAAAAKDADRISRLETRVNTLDRQSDAFSSNAAKAIMNARRILPQPQSADVSETRKADRVNVQQDDGVYDMLDYFKFQNTFRGTRSLITERQQLYVPYFSGQQFPVLDIGCGRGEFLRLMHDNGIQAFGVDLYPEYVIEGELSGLQIQQGDGIDFLEQSKETFGGIFAGQVIEHITFGQLVSLCFHAYQRLAPGACLVMETPNPTSLAIFTTTFYVDPTHNKPVHPLTLEYVLREAGFSDIQTIYTECSRPEQLPLIEGDGIKNLDEINGAIRRVSDMLYGSLDYAVVARKK